MEPIIEEPIVLLPDSTKILKLTEDEPKPEYTEEEKIIKLKKEKAQRCKVIALSSMGFHPLTHTSTLKKLDKVKLLKEVQDLFEKPDNEICLKFNEICLNELFDNADDFTSYPIYKSTY